MATPASEVTIPLQGGLGNQLFQLAAGLVINRRLGVTVRFSDHWLRHPARFETPRAFALDGLLGSDELTTTPVARSAAIARRVMHRRVLEEGPADDALSRIGRFTTVVSGYFQRLDYAEEAWQELRARLAASPHLRHRALLDPPIERYGAVHYRLGDYASSDHAKAHHGLTMPTYYSEQMSALSLDHSISDWRLVSDEPERALRLVEESGLADRWTLTSRTDSTEWDDLRTLSSASALVLSNSSFSWWGAFIASQQHEVSVVAPSPWLADPKDEPPLFPSDWVLRQRPIT